MKKIQRYLLYAFLMLSIATLAFGCKQKDPTSLGRETQGAETDAAPIQLSTPVNLKITGDVLTWDPVPNASMYVVTEQISRAQYQTVEPQLDIFEITDQADHSYYFSVYADGDGKKHLDSNRSEPATYSFPVCSGWELVLSEKKDSYIFSVTDPDKIKGKLAIPAEHNGLPVSGFDENCLKNCGGLTGVLFPRDRFSLQFSMFSGCHNLQRVRYPKSMTTFDFKCFSDCDGIQELRIPAWVKSVSGTVENIKNLTVITVDQQNPTLRSEGNCVITKDGQAIVWACHFSQIPQSAKAIGERGFAYCTSETLVIPGNIETIDDRAFSNCLSLKTIEFESGVKEFGKNLFSFCSQLERVVFSDTVTNIDIAMFSGFGASQSFLIEISESNPIYKSLGNCIFEIATSTVIYGNESSSIPEGTVIIGSNAFYECQLGDELTLPSSVRVIKAGAFYNTNLRLVRLPRNLEEVGKNAFGSLNKAVVLLPSTVKNISYNAFAYATVYTDLQDPKNIPKGWDDRVIIGASGTTTRVTWFDDARICYGCNFIYDKNGFPQLESLKITGFRFPDSAAGLKELFVPFKAGYTFVGWATEENGEPVYLPNAHEAKSSTIPHYTYTYYSCLTDEQLTALRDREDVVLYPIWIKNS